MNWIIIAFICLFITLGIYWFLEVFCNRDQDDQTQDNDKDNE